MDAIPLAAAVSCTAHSTSREVDNEFTGKAAAKKEEADFLVMGGGKGLRKKGAGKKEKEKLVLDFKVKSAIR